MVRINIEINDEIHKQAKLNSISNDKTLIEYINDAIEEKNKRDKKWERYVINVEMNLSIVIVILKIFAIIA